MLKNLFFLATFLICSSFSHSFEEGAFSSPSHDFDVRMGSDAIKSGTNVDEKTLQEQEYDESKIEKDMNLKKKKNDKEKRKDELLKPL